MILLLLLLLEVVMFHFLNIGSELLITHLIYLPKLNNILFGYVLLQLLSLYLTTEKTI